MGNHSQDGMLKMDFYNSEERFTDVLELMEFAETILGSQNKVMDLPLSSILYTRKRIVKIILSRKGFDSSNGSIPSPILPDGTLLSLPIPAKFDSISFDDLNYNGVLFSDILRQLKGKEDKTNHYNCHLDPDIRENLRNTPVSNWRAAFGQIKKLTGIIKKSKCFYRGSFSIFGWFRQTEGDIYNGTLHFKKDAPDLNIIYGYLQLVI